MRGEAASSTPDALLRPTLGVRDAVAIIVGIVIGAGIFRTPSLVAGAAGERATVLARLGGRRADLPHRRALLRRARLGLSRRRRRLPLPDARLRPAGRLPLRLGAADGDPDRLDRAAGLRLRRLRQRDRCRSGRTRRRSTPALPSSCLTAVNWLGVRQGTRRAELAHRGRGAGLVAVIVAGLVAGRRPPLPAPPAVGDARCARPGDGLRAADLRRLERGGLCLGRAERRAAADGARAGAEPALITVLYLLANAAYLRALGLAGRGGLRRRRRRPDGAACSATRARSSISLLVAVAALTSANATVITGARTDLCAGPRLRPLRCSAAGTSGAQHAAQRAAVPRAASRCCWWRSAPRADGLRADGGVHRAGLLVLLPAGRRGAVRAAPARARRAAPVPRAALPADSRPSSAPSAPTCSTRASPTPASARWSACGAGRRRRAPPPPDPEQAEVPVESPSARPPRPGPVARLLRSRSGARPPNSRSRPRRPRRSRARPEDFPDVIYVPTPQPVVDAMLKLAEVKKGDVVYDLGSGDGGSRSPRRNGTASAPSASRSSPTWSRTPGPPPGRPASHTWSSSARRTCSRPTTATRTWSPSTCSPA